MKSTKENLRLKKVTKRECPFLYDLLLERNPIFNISHKKMPTYEEHVKFVSSRPYSKWYIIFYSGKECGSIYLSKNDEIGIFLKKGLTKKGIGNKALKILMKENPRRRYLANINPKNKNSIRFFKKHHFKLLQYTYELSKYR